MHHLCYPGVLQLSSNPASFDKVSDEGPKTNFLQQAVTSYGSGVWRR